MSEHYLYEISEPELKYILAAFECRNLPSRDKKELCSHLHEESFLYQYNALIWEYSEELNTSGLFVNSLRRSVLDLSSVPFEEASIVVKNFIKTVSKLSDSETLLYCFSLLANYHEKKECSEYLSLALKCKLMAYLRCRIPDLSANMEIMKEFFQYISHYKCKYVLFMSCVDVFFSRCNFYLDFHSQSVLSEILNAAHQLRFNFFSLFNEEICIIVQKYIQRSILENLKRLLVLVKYGYEDQRFSRALFFYGLNISVDDEDNLFGFRRRVFKRRSNKKYRAYQVLFLYIKAYYNDENYDQELYEEVLKVLWKSIPDPFLSKKQFLSSFEQSDKFPEFLNVWKWYLKVVLNNVESQKSPRSLKHLTRCAIRRILTESVQLPFGIKVLDIPSSLKSYLSLESALFDQDEHERYSENNVL